MFGTKINPNLTQLLIDHMKIKVHPAPHRHSADRNDTIPPNRPDYSHPHMHTIMQKTALTAGELSITASFISLSSASSTRTRRGPCTDLPSDGERQIKGRCLVPLGTRDPSIITAEKRKNNPSLHRLASETNSPAPRAVNTAHISHKVFFLFLLPATLQIS